MEGMMSGKYQFGSAALDNTIAYTEGQGDVKIDNFDSSPSSACIPA